MTIQNLIAPGSFAQLRVGRRGHIVLPFVYILRVFQMNTQEVPDVLSSKNEPPLHLKDIDSRHQSIHTRLRGPGILT